MNNISNLTASISTILKNNNLHELSFGDVTELSDPTYIIWWDNNGTPYEDPVIKVTSDNDGLSFEVDARDFGDTVTVQDYDIDRLEWWQGIHANMLEVLQRDEVPRCLACGKPLNDHRQFCSDTCRQFASFASTTQDIAKMTNNHTHLVGEERYHKIKELQKKLQVEQKALLIDLLKHNGGRVTLHPISNDDEDIEYPVTMTFYEEYNNPDISITDVYLNEHEEPYVDGIDEATGSVKQKLQVYPEQISWVLDFLAIVLDLKEMEIPDNLTTPHMQESMVTTAECENEADVTTESSIWMRLGVTVTGSKEEIEKILQGDEAVLACLLGKRKFNIDGETYIPSSCIEEYNNQNKTSFEEEDIEFHSLNYNLETNNMTPQEQVKSLTDKLIANLCRTTKRPDGWLPHIVYVEEEGDYPVYNRYELLDYTPEGICTLYNPRTDSRKNDFHLSEINIDWLITVWNRYIELCIEQGIWKDRAIEILQNETTAGEMLIREFVEEHWQNLLPDEDNIQAFKQLTN